jgi:hypothetical protein
MPTLSRLAIAVTLATLANCAPPGPSAYEQLSQQQAEFSRNWHQMNGTVHENIDEFLAGPPGDCQATSINTALTVTREAGERLPSWAAPVGIFRLEQERASWFLDLADAAASHGCPKLADQVYREVIKTYIGSDYAAQRQRAQIGIEDVRAAAQSRQ